MCWGLVTAQAYVVESCVHHQLFGRISESTNDEALAVDQRQGSPDAHQAFKK
jgi:hypothetical protein